jgi:hypothetical protein
MASQTQRGLTGLLVRMSVALAYGGQLTGSFEGVREVVRACLARLYVLYMCLVTVLKLIGWKCCFLWAFAGVVGSPFQVPSEPACASSGLSRQASLVDTPSVAHFYERLGSMRRDHSLTHQRIKTRNFQLINAQILKAHPYPNPSRH